MDGEPILFTHANALTMNPEAPRAEALLVRDGKIAAIGDHADVEPRASGARRVDLGGQTVVPGFNDCHCHILDFGLRLEELDVGADAVDSIEDIERVVAQRAERLAGDEWVLGNGYDQNRLRERRHPTRSELDRAGSGRPVVLWHTSGHGLSASSRALELAGITAQTESPAGGSIERDEHGEPTGVLLEAPAMNLLDRVIPEPTVEEGAAAILQAMTAMARQGITSASDAATGRDNGAADGLEMYRRALRSGRLDGRITLMPQIVFVAPPGERGARKPDEFDAGDEPDWLRVGATKIFSDGALTTRTAALREPFADSNSTGILIWEPGTLADMIDRAHAAGWQIGTHAIGDRAIEIVVDAYERALARSPREDHRHRIEHCMLLDEALGRRIRRLGLVPTIQPGFIGRLGDAYIAGLGGDRASRLNPMGLFERLAIPVGFSSDRPVIPGAPLQGIHSAMVRTTPDGVTLGREHVIPAEDAIRFYTSGSAYAIRAERQRGSLRPGMLADLTVLSQDPTTTDPEEFGRVQVTMTVTGGRIVFEG